MTQDKYTQRNGNHTVGIDKLQGEYSVYIVIRGRRLYVHEGSEEHCNLIYRAYRNIGYKKGVVKE